MSDARTSETAVKAIIDTELTVDEVAPFLSTAHVMVDALLTGEEYGEDLLTQIETWLAAHFVAVRDPRISKEKAGEGDWTYHGKSGLGLNHTPYGQQVMILDHHGVLAEVAASKMSAVMKVIG